MKTVSCFLMVCGLVLLYHPARSQQKDSIPAFIKGKDTTLVLKAGKKTSKMDSPYKSDTAGRKKHDPRRATLYSTFLPGLGQIYNRKYWKLPIVYAAVGIPAYTYFYNKSWYQKCQYALAVLLDSTFVQPAVYSKIDPKLRVFVDQSDPSDLISYRNEFRKDQDYSVIFFMLFWGLQIVDATVDAHLMNFDISSDLSMHIQQPSVPDNASPSFQTGLSSMSSLAGLSLVFELHKPRFKPIVLP